MNAPRVVGTAAAAALTVTLAACSTGGVVVASGPPGPGPSTAATLGIPPGHLPPVGQCRVWIPGEPPGHQRAPGSCAVQATRVPPHGWLVFNPGGDGPGKGRRGKGRRGRGHRSGQGAVQIRVTVYGSSAPEVVRWYERESGELVREEAAG